MEEILNNLTHDTLDKGVTLLKSHAIENVSLREVVDKVTYGINIPFHYKKYMLGMYEEWDKENKIIINKQKINYEELWEELDNRIALIIKTMNDLEDGEPVQER